MLGSGTSVQLADVLEDLHGGRENSMNFQGHVFSGLKKTFNVKFWDFLILHKDT